VSTRREQKELARARRLELEAARRAQARRKRWRAGVATTVTALVLLGGAIAVTAGGASHTAPASTLPAGTLASLETLGTLKSPGAPGTVGPEGVPIPDAPPLAGDDDRSVGAPVDGIECQGGEQVLFHIHAHLTVFVNGTVRQVPYGIGIPGAQVSPAPGGPYVGAGNCFYWLHTHAADGIIHTESPVERTYTLGNFFDVWGQKLSSTEVGPARGTVTALYNGQVFRGNPRDIPLTRHAQIQLEVGRPVVAPVAIRFPSGL
jgi:hypothetical protein